MELDYRTGQVLNAIKEAGIEGNTIVIWLSDNSACPTGNPMAYWGGSSGPFWSLTSPCLVSYPTKVL